MRHMPGGEDDRIAGAGTPVEQEPVPPLVPGTKVVRKHEG